MKPILLAFATALLCGCTSQTSSNTPTPSTEPSPSPSTVASPTGPASLESPVPRQVLPPATDQPVANLCSEAVIFTADGNVTPILCPSGAVNVRAWQFYAGVSASILGLGLNPTQGQAEAAICDDFKHNHATKAEEANGYKLAATYYGWSFSIDPSMVNCP